MFHDSGLSLDQAPAFGGPLRFFLTAPLFGLLAGGAALAYGPELMESRWSPAAVATVHLVTLGFLTMVMAGALQQMLPVLAGAKIPKPKLFAFGLHAALSLGTLSMAAGFLFTMPGLLLAGAFLLGSGLLPMALLFLFALIRDGQANPSALAMRFALAAFLIALTMGLHLLSGHGLGRIGEHHQTLADLHILWAFFGWVGLLVVGVAYQVMPMFYVAPEFPAFCRKWMVPATFVFLAAASLLFLRDGWAFVLAAKLLAALPFLAFALIAARRLRARKRPLPDATLRFWVLALLLLAAGTVLWIAAPPGGEPLLRSAVIALGGFALALVNGMLYKIVPFLAWFHLTNKGYMTVPTIREMIPESRTHLQLVLFAAALALTFLSVWLPLLFRPGATLWIAAFLLLFLNLAGAAKSYREKLKTPPELAGFDLEALAASLPPAK